jgi:AcrR family transcriptional regulator
LEHVLECATRLIIAHDPQSVTTTMVAAAAGVSVGSIYRYFQDKEALFAQILENALTRLAARLEESDFDLAVEDWRSAVMESIDTVVEFVADDAVFRKLWFSTMLTPQMVAANRSHDLNLAKRMAQHLQPRRDPECARDTIRVCEIFFGIIDTGIDLAFRSGNPNGDARKVTEMKVAAVRYIESYLE